MYRWAINDHAWLARAYNVVLVLQPRFHSDFNQRSNGHIAAPRYHRIREDLGVCALQHDSSKKAILDKLVARLLRFHRNPSWYQHNSRLPPAGALH